MSLPAGQQRRLHQIERALQVSEPHLVSKFAIFTRLATPDGPIGRERIRAPGLRRRLRPAFRSVTLIPVAIGLLIAAIVLSGTAHGSGGCLPGWHSIPAAHPRGGAGCGVDTQPVMTPAPPSKHPAPPSQHPAPPSRYMRIVPHPG